MQGTIARMSRRVSLTHGPGKRPSSLTISRRVLPADPSLGSPGPLFHTRPTPNGTGPDSGTIRTSGDGTQVAGRLSQPGANRQLFALGNRTLLHAIGIQPTNQGTGNVGRRSADQSQHISYRTDAGRYSLSRHHRGNPAPDLRGAR